MTKKGLAIGLAMVGTAAAVTAWALHGPGMLTINGKSVSTSFLASGGKTYVPLSDVAKALGSNVVKTADGYSIQASGGEMLHGLNGKLNETLSGPGLQFTVMKVIRTSKYTRQFGTGTIEPPDDSSEVVALICRIRNTNKSAVFTNPLGADNTNLADLDEHSYPPQRGVDTDLRPGDANILPGAVYDFALTFRVPKNEMLKVLVYETAFFPKNSTFRVDLTAANKKAE